MYTKESYESFKTKDWCGWEDVKNEVLNVMKEMSIPKEEYDIFVTWYVTEAQSVISGIASELTYTLSKPTYDTSTYVQHIQETFDHDFAEDLLEEIYINFSDEDLKEKPIQNIVRYLWRRLNCEIGKEPTEAFKDIINK